VITYLAQRTQSNHAAFAEYSTPLNLALNEGIQQGVFDLKTPQGLIAINNQVNVQALTLAYLQDFRLMMWVTMAAIPLVFLLKAPP